MSNERSEISTAAQAAHQLFLQIAPDVAPRVADTVARLFLAQNNGDTFIFVSESEAANLSEAAPLVASDGSAPIVLQGKRVFFAKNWQLERELAANIARLMCHEPKLPEKNTATQRLREWFADSGSVDQQAAAALAMLKNFVVISGGPGTGKTTTVAKLLALLCEDSANIPRIALVAPTGKAAARLSQALQNAVRKMTSLPENIAAQLTQLSGQTVHRLLGIRPPQMVAEFNENNRLPLDIVVIDEASMLDNYLFLQLLLALPDGCRVLVLGDKEQLPSVGAGAVLAALTQNSELNRSTLLALQDYLPERNWQTLSENYARLTISHRFDGQSGIGVLAANILSGSQNAWKAFVNFPKELQIQSSKRKLVSELFRQHSAYWQAIQNGDVNAAFAEQNKLIVLAALRSDVQAINDAYRKLLIQKGIIENEAIWYVGQMILITRNSPAQNLYNGDMGIVMKPENREHLVACFADKNGTWREMALARLPEMETAFALTVHKSQGSEYDEIWYVAPENIAANRALVYTALTRAKQRFVYFGDENGFQAACENAATRRSGLGQFLANRLVAMDKHQ